MNRESKNRLFIMIFGGSLLLCFTILLFLMGSMIYKGIGSLSLSFFFSKSESFGMNGGIIYQILGSLMLIAGCSIVSIPLALGTALFKTEFIKRPRLKEYIDITLLVLNGIPSLIYGLFGLIFFVYYLDMGVSWIVGSLILGVMIIPAVTISIFQSINSIQNICRESALSLGLSKWQVIRSIVLPRALVGVLTGLLLGLSRAVGETAPILFTATVFSGVTLPEDFLEPVVSLPTHILYLTQQAVNKQAIENAWGASLVLLMIVLLLNIFSYLFRLYFKRKINNAC